MTARVAAMVLAAAAFGALPATALGAGAHKASTHKAKHKKKHKKTRAPLVTCASVHVTCHTKGNGQGRPGPAGGTGGTGAPGPAGNARVAHIGLASPVATTPAGVALTLTGATWTQPAGQDEFLRGTATITPPTGLCSDTTAGDGTVTIWATLDGTVVGLAELDSYMLGRPETIAFLWGEGFAVDGTVPSVSASTSHTLSLSASDDCTQSPGATDFTVSAINIDVLQA
ncbi:MAG TPA: hypothetical protein VHX88_13470 [Solirubrobacteraceae bacterium]|nr:hypothetical protein [Solirubrobacteraceae bacterium]